MEKVSDYLEKKATKGSPWKNWAMFLIAVSSREKNNFSSEKEAIPEKIDTSSVKLNFLSLDQDLLMAWFRTYEINEMNFRKYLKMDQNIVGLVVEQILSMSYFLTASCGMFLFFFLFFFFSAWNMEYFSKYFQKRMKKLK